MNKNPFAKAQGLNKKAGTQAESRGKKYDYLMRVIKNKAIVLVLASIFSLIQEVRAEVRDSVLVIGRDVKEIPAYTYRDRTDIKEVRISADGKLEKIGEYAFLGCTNLERIELPPTVTALGEGAFRECGSLPEISIPRGVTAIPRYCFAWCGSLEKVELPRGIKDIAAHSFAYCGKLSGIEIPGSVTHIGSNAFSRCESLKEIRLPASIKELESYAFSDCSSLERATLPANGNMLGELIFSGCERLGELEMPWQIPPKFDCDSYIFEPDEEEAYRRCELKVPSGSREAYSKAPGWKLFFRR